MGHKIPIVYLVIKERLNENSFGGIIKLNKARRVLQYIFRMPSGKVNSIITEMEKYDLVKFENCRVGLLIK